MSDPKKILIVAGEPSGELLGAQLMRAMRNASSLPLKFMGVGGTQMIGEGLYPFFPMSDIALMGAAEILPKLRNIFRRMNSLADMVARITPDLVVLIDSPEFTLRLAKRIRRRNPATPIALYVAPQVWASRPGRARKMSRFVDHIFALLPFEKPFFEGSGIPCTIVGHPVIERKPLVRGGPEIRRRMGVSENVPLVCLLPGSRLNEVKRLLPIYGQVVDNLLTDFPDCRFIMPVVEHVHDLVEREIRKWKTPPILIRGETDKFATFDASDVALAASGTVSLELALARVPAVIVYRVDPVTAFVARRIVTARYANLINLIVDCPAIPELIQQDCTVENMTKHMVELVRFEDKRNEQLAYVDRAVAQLGLGDRSPSERAATAIFKAFIEKGAMAKP